VQCAPGYTTVRGEVRYNGQHVWSQWVNCMHGATGRHTHDYWLRIDVGVKGSVKIRGGR
jgi:hypothetical protein